MQSEFQPRYTREKYHALAMKYLDHANWKEQRYILARDAGFKKDRKRAKAELLKLVERYPDEKGGFYGLAGYADSVQESIRYYERAIEIDPLFKLPYNGLAYVYKYLGDSDKAIAAVNKYIELAPDESNPYDTKGDIYISMNKPEEALAAFAKCDELTGKTDGGVITAEIWLMQGKIDKAERVFRREAEGPLPGSADARTYLSMTRMFEGRYKEAITMLEEGIRLDERDSVGAGIWVHEQKYLEKAVIYLELGDRAAAARELLRFHADKFYPMKDWIRDLYFYIIGQLEHEPLARDAFQAWRDSLETPRSKGKGEYWFALGMMALSDGDSKAAAGHFKKLKSQGVSCFLDHYMLAQAYLESGEPGEAIGELEESLKFCEYPQGGRIAFANLVANAYYQLGTASEAVGIKSKAIENYRKFLDIRKNADPDRPEVADARRRLARLS